MIFVMILKRPIEIKLLLNINKIDPILGKSGKLSMSFMIILREKKEKLSFKLW